MSLEARWYRSIFNGVPEIEGVPAGQMNLLVRLVNRKLAENTYGTRIERNVESEAGQQAIPSVPPTLGPEEFSPNKLENQGAIVANMLGFLIPVLGQIIDADFSPASVIRGARDSIASLRAITRGHSRNEYGILVDAIGQSVGAAPHGWHKSDLDRASQMLIEFIRIQLGVKEEVRDLSAEKAYLESLGQSSDNVYRMHKGTPKTSAESGSLVARTIGPPRFRRLRNAWIKNGPRGSRGVVGVAEAVKNSLGIKTTEKYHEREVYSNRMA